MLSDGVIPPKISADLIALNYKGDMGLNALHVFSLPSHPALKLLPFLQHVCIQQAPPQALSMLPLEKNLQTDRKRMNIGIRCQRTPIRSRVCPYHDFFL